MSDITTEQKKHCADVITDAVRKALEEGVNTLQTSGHLNGVNIDCIQPEDYILWYNARLFVKKTLMQLTGQTCGPFNLFFGPTNLLLEPTDGTDTIAKAVDLFNGRIDGSFTDGLLVEAKKPTNATTVKVYELDQSMNLSEACNYLGSSFGKLCLEESQILQFVRENIEWYKKPDNSICNLIFLTKYQGFRFVVLVCFTGDEDGSVDKDKLNVKIRVISDNIHLHVGIRRYLFVVPKLAPTLARVA